jgi:hypothetical protein
MSGLTVLTYPVEVVEITANVVPEPAGSSVQDNTVLFSVVVVRLVLTPCRLTDYVT